MPSVLHECDIALFPSRCEGGTNLVAMEAMACGVPTYVSANTGQNDLIDLLGCHAFSSQRPVKVPAGSPSVADWGGTDPDEIEAALESVYTSREQAQKQALEIADKMKAWD